MGQRKRTNGEATQKGGIGLDLLRHAAVVAGAMFAGACAPPYGQEYERLEEVLEVTARWAFENAGTDLEPPAALCLAISTEGNLQADPTDSFLDRFVDSKVRVVPLSECEILTVDPDNFDERTRHQIVDRDSGGFALIFHVGPVEWESSASAKVDVSYLQGGLWGMGWECEVERSETNGWRVAACQVTTVA